MPIITCPECQTKLNVKDESLGKKAKCPKCARVIVLAASSASLAISPSPPSVSPPPLPLQQTHVTSRPFPQSVDDERLTRRSPASDEAEDDGIDDLRAPDFAAWGRARTGVRLVSIAVLLVLLGTIVVQGTTMFVFFREMDRVNPPARRGGDPLLGVVMAVGCSMLIAILVGLVGTALASSAPDRSAALRARVTTLAAVFAILGAVGLGLYISMSAPLPPRPMAAQNPIGRAIDLGIVGVAGTATIGILLLVGFVFWILFHVAVGKHFQSPSLVRFSFGYLIGVVVIVVLAIGYGVLLELLFRNPIDFRMKFFCANVGGIIQNLLIYGLFLILCGKTIRVMTPPRT